MQGELDQARREQREADGPDEARPPAFTEQAPREPSLTPLVFVRELANRLAILLVSVRRGSQRLAPHLALHAGTDVRLVAFGPCPGSRREIRRPGTRREALPGGRILEHLVGSLQHVERVDDVEHAGPMDPHDGAAVRPTDVPELRRGGDAEQRERAFGRARHDPQR